MQGIHKKICGFLNTRSRAFTVRVLCALLLFGVVLVIPALGSLYADTPINPESVVNTPEAYTYVNFYASWFNFPYSENQQLHDVKRADANDKNYINTDIELWFKTEFNTVGTFQNFTLTVESLSGTGVNGDMGDAYTKIDFSNTQTGLEPFAGLDGRTLLYKQSVNPGAQGNGLIHVKYDIASLGHEFYDNRRLVLTLKGTHTFTRKLDNGGTEVVTEDVELVRELKIELKSKQEVDIRKDVYDYALGDVRDPIFKDPAKAYVAYRLHFVTPTNNPYMPCVTKAVLTDAIQSITNTFNQVVQPTDAYIYSPSDSTANGGIVKPSVVGNQKIVNQSFTAATRTWTAELKSDTPAYKPFWLFNQNASTGTLSENIVYLLVEYPAEAFDFSANNPENHSVVVKNSANIDVYFDNENYNKPQGTISDVAGTTDTLQLITFSGSGGSGTVTTQKLDGIRYDIAPLLKGRDLSVTFPHRISYSGDHSIKNKVIYYDYDHYEHNSAANADQPRVITYLSDATGLMTDLLVNRAEQQYGVTLSKPIMQISQIEVTSMVPVTRYNAESSTQFGKVTFYKKGSTTPIAVFTAPGIFNVPAGETITEYYAVADEAYGSGSVQFQTKWRINHEPLSQILSEQEMESMALIRNYHQGYMNFEGENAAYSNITTRHLGTAELSLAKSVFGVNKLSGFRFNYGQNQVVSNVFEIYMEPSMTTSPVCNDDPWFYIELSEGLQYQLETLQIQLANEKVYAIDPASMDIIVLPNGRTVVKFQCLGSYYHNTKEGSSESVHIRVSFDAALKQTAFVYPIRVWMGTQTDLYVQPVADSNNLQSLDPRPDRTDKLAMQLLRYDMDVAMNMILTNHVYEMNGGLTDAPDYTYLSSDTATFRLTLFNGMNRDRFNSFEIVTRLPFIGNTSVLNPLADGAQMHSEFDTQWQSFVKAYIVDADGNQTPIDLADIQILYNAARGADQIDINSSDNMYTSDPTDATTVKFILPDNLEIKYLETLVIEYKVDLPDIELERGKISWEQFTARYKVIGDGNSWQRTPEAAKVGICLDEEEHRGKVFVKKTTSDNRPYVQGIEFTVTNIFTGESYVRYTDEKGEATFDALPRGYYKIEETGGVHNSYAKTQAKFFTISNNTAEHSFTFHNVTKKAKMTVLKTFEDHGGNADRLYPARFRLYGKSDTGETVNITVESADGILQFTDIPLGTYTLEELYPTGMTAENGKYGFALMAPMEVKITGDKQVIELSVTNLPAYGALRIIKTSQDNRLLEGRIFHIYGTSVTGTSVSEFITTNAQGIGVVKLPVGVYWVEEIETPDCYSKPEIQKITVVESAFAQNVALHPAEVHIFNGYRYGDLTVRKGLDASSRGVSVAGWVFKITGESRYENMNPVEYYGVTDSNGYIVDENGERRIPLAEADENGYTVQEIGRIEMDKLRVEAAASLMRLFTSKAEFDDALREVFTAQYGNDFEAPTADTITMPLGIRMLDAQVDGHSVEIGADNTVTGIHVKDKTRTVFEGINIYDGKGRIVVEKIADGGDITKALGIRFIISGKDLANRDVYEVITTKRMTIDGREAAVAISVPLPAGVYSIREDESSVPEDYYVTLGENATVTVYPDNNIIVELPEGEDGEAPALDMREINVLNYLVIHNKPKQGRLLIRKITDPAGGPVAGITFRVKCLDGSQGEGMTFQTNADGEISISILKPGKYEIEEILDGALGGYYPLEGIYKQVVLVQDEQTTTVVFTNVLKDDPPPPVKEETRLVIQKKIINKYGDSATPENYREAGLDADYNYSFNITVVNLETGDEYNGILYRDSKLVFSNLPYGRYAIRENCNIPFRFVSIVETDSHIAAYDGSTGEFEFTRSSESDDCTWLELEVTNRIQPNGFHYEEEAFNLIRQENQDVERTHASLTVHVVQQDGEPYIGNCLFELLDGSDPSAAKRIGYVDAKGTLYYTTDSGTQNYSTQIAVNKGAMSIRRLPGGMYYLNQISIPPGVSGGLVSPMQIVITAGNVAHAYVHVDTRSKNM